MRRVALAVVLLTSGQTRAADTHVRALTAVSAGGSDNAKVVSSSGAIRRSSSVYSSATLGLDIARQTEGTGLQLLWALEATGYPNSPESNGVSQELALGATFVGGRTYLELGVTAAYGVMNDISSPLDDLPEMLGPDGNLILEPRGINPDDLGPQPEGLVQFAGAGAVEGMGVELTERLGWFQSIELQTFSQIIGKHIDPPILYLSASTGLGYALTQVDNVGLNLDAGYEDSPELNFGDEILPAGKGQFGRATLGWSRQLTPNWRGDIAAGAYAARTDLADDFSYGPAWRASVRWRHKRWRVGTVVDHGANASVVMGGIFITDRATLKVQARLGRDDSWRFALNFRAQRMYALGEPPARTGPASRYQPQVLLGWKPWHRRYLEFGVSYRLTRQDGAILGNRNLRTFERNAVLLTFTAGFPVIGFEELDEAQ